MIVENNKIVVCSYCGNAMEYIDKKVTCLSCFSESDGKSRQVVVNIPDELLCEIPDCPSKVRRKEDDIYEVVGAHKNFCVNGRIMVGDILTFDEIPFVDMRFKKFYCGCKGWN